MIIGIVQRHPSFFRRAYEIFAVIAMFAIVAYVLKLSIAPS